MSAAVGWFDRFILWICQSARDIESKMRSETRLKLFMLDPDTQVITQGPDLNSRFIGLTLSCFTKCSLCCVCSSAEAGSVRH